MKKLILLIMVFSLEPAKATDWVDAEENRRMAIQHPVIPSENAGPLEKKKNIPPLEKKVRPKGYKSLSAAATKLESEDLQALSEGRAGISIEEEEYELTSEDQESLKYFLKWKVISTKITQDASGIRIIILLESMKMEHTWRHCRPLEKALYAEASTTNTNMQLAAASSGGDNPPPPSQNGSENQNGGNMSPSAPLAGIVSDLVQQGAGRARRLKNTHLSNVEEEGAELEKNTFSSFEMAPPPSPPAGAPPTEPPSSLSENIPTVPSPPVAMLAEVPQGLTVFSEQSSVFSTPNSAGLRSISWNNNFGLKNRVIPGSRHGVAFGRSRVVPLFPDLSGLRRSKSGMTRFYSLNLEPRTIPSKILLPWVREQSIAPATGMNTALMIVVLLTLLMDTGFATVTNIMASLTALSFLLDRAFAMIGLYALSIINPYRRKDTQERWMAVWDVLYPLPRFTLAYNHRGRG